MNVLINIDVDDLSKAIRFYSTAFSLEVGRRFGDGGVELIGSSAPIYLLVKEAGTPSSSMAFDTRRYDRHWTPVHLDWVVDDIESAVKRAVEAGARIENAISTQKWGRLALMADPFGHGFCFIQFLGAGYDEIAS
ncbi:putative glyoxalase superfamily protein PhnB [Trinickia symbiotica]|uniref:Glyoxalase/bleomycin resistance/dioxygenase family protein n=2 Tax=Trinickia symbiotica TaxID=863227 RepID=A0A2N7XB12_9BURK|nr:glyoxalase/bleomycin resistance/dioxygenase family protein [Trinickia symbiotica]PPK46870.1 putative glyoxalase superfamily protein PhnB [Trinickia symbiotica]